MWAGGQAGLHACICLFGCACMHACACVRIRVCNLLLLLPPHLPDLLWPVHDGCPARPSDAVVVCFAQAPNGADARLQQGAKPGGLKASKE